MSTLIAGHKLPCITLNFLPTKSVSNDHNQDKSVKGKGEFMGKYELLDQTIDSILHTYSGLKRAFVKGHPRHPFIGDVGQRWVPLHSILSEPWTMGEARIVAVLVEVFVSEYGADEVINFNVDDMFFFGEYISHSEQLWPVVYVVTKELRAFDREAYRLISKLIGMYN